MVEVRAFEPSVLQVLASPGAIAAAIEAAPAAGVAPVAPDEVLLIAAAAGPIVDAVSAVDADGLVLDVSDGWSAWTLDGADAREAFARLSELDLPGEGFVQGEVARLPVKVLAGPELVTLLIPAMWGDYLGERIRTDCAALGVRQVSS
jgi:sarcosine oxidase gamma subunit